MISVEFILVSITTAFSSILYLILSRYLDNFISPIISNAIGLIIDISLDFIFQSYIFLNKINFKDDTLHKFIISKIITTLSSQTLFVIYMKYFNNRNLNLTIVRFVISSFVFMMLVYPLSKFYVFNNKKKLK